MVKSKELQNQNVDDGSSTHFGFKTVPEESKERLVRGVFDAVAPQYDVMNDLMSGGLHRLWKLDMVNWLNAEPDWHILDVAGGTGDIAHRIREKAQREHGSAPKLTICDINAEMLREGRSRAIDRGVLNAEGVEWVCGNAESLPLPDSSVDAYTIAFGIRNVTHIDIALQEARRVLKPGGRFMCLEFSKVQFEPLSKLYDAYSMHVIPRIGKVVAGSAEPYQYLVESIRRFPDQKRFADMIREAGFGAVEYRSLTGGIVAIHSGWKV